MNQHINTLVVAAVIAVISSLVGLNIQIATLGQKVTSLDSTLSTYHKDYNDRFGRLEEFHFKP